MSKPYRQDSPMYQAFLRAGLDADDGKPFDDAWPEELPPWVDAPKADERTTDTSTATFDSQIEDTAMTATTQTTETTLTRNQHLEAFFSQLGQFPRNNVLERTIQTLISESARAAEFGDRVEFGDDALPPIELDSAGFPATPIDQYERPAPDTDGSTSRTLSEAQYALLLNLRDDEVTALEMAAELVGVFEAINGEKPAYGIVRSPAGRWDRITDIHMALKKEYMRAHAAWLRKQGQQADLESSRFAAEGSQSLQQQVRNQRRQVLGAF